MDCEKIILSSVPVEIAEHKDYKLATFLISVLDEYDLNGRMIPKEVGELYHSTIVGFPIVAKLVTDYMGNPIDFAGHEMTIVKDKDGNSKAKFGTMPIGSVIDSYIEKRMVDGYEGLKSCLMIQAKLWHTRFPSYFEVLDKLWAENNVKSSWEVTVEKAEKTIKGRILKSLSFIGNCLLGSKVLGAVPKAGVYEYAELNSETLDVAELELAKALSNDACQVSNIYTSKEQEEKNLDNKEKNTQQNTVAEVTKISENSENIKKYDTPVAEKEQLDNEISALTERDLRDKIRKACKDKIKKWCWISWHFPVEKTVWVEVEDRESELDFILFTYEVVNDEVVVSEPQNVKLTVSISQINSTIAQKDEALVKANEKIQELNSEISNLQPFKDAYEKAEQERIEAETSQKRIDLKAKIEKSNLFTKEEIDSTEISSLIEQADETAIKNLMADKFMASLDKKEATVEISEVVTETDEKQVKANIDNSDNEIGSITELLSAYSHK